ncbi:hypothetical protein PIB30_050543 [Stylosanthes scabra]|uniref:Uncharacterized protein n=1 Tax=Stylosanthes scabra TaxID=79078 RepID=A0ABU6XJ98_9FABA|nr:hypothetical protein [Stylosanthes scabra]
MSVVCANLTLRFSKNTNLMGDKGKSVDHHDGQKGFSAKVSAVDCVRWDDSSSPHLTTLTPFGLRCTPLFEILTTFFSFHVFSREIPELNPMDLAGKEQPVVVVLNTFREHLLERDTSNKALLQANGRQVKALTDAVAGQAKMMELMWSEHCDMKKTMAEERELTRKAVVYSLERSSAFSVPEKKPTIREELLRAFGAKSVVLELGTSSGKRQQSASGLKRRLDFDLVGDSDDYVPTEAGFNQPVESNRDKLIKYGYVGSADFPLFLKVCFRSTPRMSFLMTSAACGAYVFSKCKDKSEILFQSDNFKANRRSFWSLWLNHYKVFPFYHRSYRRLGRLYIGITDSLAVSSNLSATNSSVSYTDSPDKPSV